MADSLKLVGIKRVSSQTGADLTIVTPIRGGDHHKIRRWWSDNKNVAPYVNCTKFKFPNEAECVMSKLPIVAPALCTLHTGQHN